MCVWRGLRSLPMAAEGLWAHQLALPPALTKKVQSLFCVFLLAPFTDACELPSPQEVFSNLGPCWVLSFN